MTLHRRSRRRRGQRRGGATFLELLASLAILGMVLTMIVQCSLAGGRAFRETRRRDRALELCNHGLERALLPARLAPDDPLVAEIEAAVSDASHTLQLEAAEPVGESAMRRWTATVSWENDLGKTHSLQLHGWRTDLDFAAAKAAAVSEATAANAGAAAGKEEDAT